MPWNAEHKQKSRGKILSSAARLFTKKGFDAVSIDDVMQHAGLTRGAFYAHFKSKSDVYSQSVLHGAHKAKEHLCKLGVNTPIGLAEDYLKIGTKETEQEYCTLAFLVTDMAHRERQVKSTYTRVLKGYQDLLCELGMSEKTAIQASILLIGGLAISRAITDKELKSKMLAQCLEAVKTLQAGDHESPRNRGSI